MRVKITTELRGLDRVARRLRKVLKRALVRMAPGKNLELSVFLVGEDGIRELNRLYRAEDRLTDVLAFPQLSPEELEGVMGKKCRYPELLGDIVICVPVARRQAKEREMEEVEELELLAVHGLLHLMGYEDNNEEARMRMEGTEEALLGRNINKGV